MENNLSNLSETKSQTFMHVLVDYAFKRIFATPHNKNIQMSVLNAFLQDYIGEIKDIELLQTEQLGIMPNDKKLSYDVYAKEGDGRRFLIEMQREGQTFYSRRAIAYVSRAVSNELRKGDRKYTFPDIISLNFLEQHHAKIMGGRKFLQRVTLKNEDNEIFSEKIMFFFVDLRPVNNARKHSRSIFPISVLWVWDSIPTMAWQKPKSLLRKLFRRLLHRCYLTKYWPC